jgi:hypothetical protein
MVGVNTLKSFDLVISRDNTGHIVPMDLVVKIILEHSFDTYAITGYMLFLDSVGYGGSLPLDNQCSLILSMVDMRENSYNEHFSITKVDEYLEGKTKMVKVEFISLDVVDMFIEHKSRAFEDKTHSEIVSSIFNDFGVSVPTIDMDTKHELVVTPQNQNTFITVNKLIKDSGIYVYKRGDEYFCVDKTSIVGEEIDEVYAQVNDLYPNNIKYLDIDTYDSTENIITYPDTNYMKFDPLKKVVELVEVKNDDLLLGLNDKKIEYGEVKSIRTLPMSYWKNDKENLHFRNNINNIKVDLLSSGSFSVGLGNIVDVEIPEQIVPSNNGMLSGKYLVYGTKYIISADGLFDQELNLRRDDFQERR